MKVLWGLQAGSNIALHVGIPMIAYGCHNNVVKEMDKHTCMYIRFASLYSAGVPIMVGFTYEVCTSIRSNALPFLSESPSVVSASVKFQCLPLSYHTHHDVCPKKKTLARFPTPKLQRSSLKKKIMPIRKMRKKKPHKTHTKTPFKKYM